MNAPTTMKTYDGVVGILACPFCGQPAEIRSDREPAQVGCFNPDCIKPKSSSTCMNTAVLRWNTRNGKVVDP